MCCLRQYKPTNLLTGGGRECGVLFCVTFSYVYLNTTNLHSSTPDYPHNKTHVANGSVPGLWTKQTPESLELEWFSVVLSAAELRNGSSKVLPLQLN
jgi:hypothetical protein